MVIVPRDTHFLRQNFSHRQQSSEWLALPTIFSNTCYFDSLIGFIRFRGRITWLRGYRSWFRTHKLPHFLAELSWTHSLNLLETRDDWGDCN